ncbi:acetyltransferase [Streptomyces chartreusis]|nr:acetyltransferase [Streptomyces chartreusis]
MLAAFADPVMRYQVSEPVASLDAAYRWLTHQSDQWDSGEGFAFAAVDAMDVVLGNAAVRVVDQRHRTGWVSYWTTTTSRNKGIASKACRSLARWSFDEPGLFRLELGHRINNPASCRVAKAAGFAVEGIERQKLEYDGVRFDVERHGRLATDTDPTMPV